MAGIFSLSKYLPRASPRHVQPYDSEKCPEDSDLDVMLVYPESKESAEDWPAKFRAITKFNVFSFRMQPKTSPTEKNLQDSPEEVSHLPADAKPEGAYDGSSTRPVVFVAEGLFSYRRPETPEARTAYEELRQPEPTVLDHMRRPIPFAGRVYGVIELRRKSNLKSTFLFAWIQWSHSNIMRNYSRCRQSTDACKAAIQPKIITNPPTWFVVYAMIMFSMNFWEQYYKNREDYYQRLCLVTGITMGFLLSPSVSSAESLSTLMATTAFAMMCSAFGHLIWRRYFSTCEKRLEQKLYEWKEEARRTQRYSREDLKLECGTQKPHVVKFHELD